MTNLTFFSGVGEIGGNKILLEDQDTTLLLDFGMSFGQSGKFFSEFMQPRKCNCLKDFFATGLLPELAGVYRQDYLAYHGVEPETRSVDGLLLSHAHADHAQYIHHLRRDIPLYMSPASKAILTTLETTGASICNELTCRKTSFTLRPKKRGEGLTKVKGEEAKEDRSIHPVHSGQRFCIGSIEVTPYDVDHSLPGATAYLIHTSEGNVLYTGDLRFHGYRTETTRDMVTHAGDQGVDLLITEGTRVTDDTGNTENDVQTQAKREVQETDGLVVVNFPQRDLDRLITFHKVAQDTGRKLVLGFKHAFMLEQFERLGDYPRLDDPDICFFADRKGWGIIGRADYPDEIIRQDYARWERQYLDRTNTLNYRDIQHQSDYLFYCNFFQLNELIDIDPVPGSKYLRSLCEPFNEEMTLDEKRVTNWLNLFGLGKPIQIHASGHAAGAQIHDMINQLNPQQLIPIHTENHQWFQDRFHQTRFVEQGKTITI